MRTLRPSRCLLILPFCLVGCASTTGVSSKVRTVATIGDKPLPVITGEPGTAIAADRVAPERRVNPEGRISGRVVDEQGHPVPGVRVRLAVNGAPGGKVVRATTDRSGAFTLRGLRPGSTYTVIAERDDGRGLLTGRSEARAPDIDVRIALLPADDDLGKASASTSTRVNAVSNRAPREEETDEPEASPAVNTEDLPPAPEAEALAPTAGRRTASDDAPTRTAGWRRGEPGRSASARSGRSSAKEKAEPPAEESAPAPDDGETHGTATTPEEPSLEDDGPNPLPPALGSDRTMAPKPIAPPEETREVAQTPTPVVLPEVAKTSGQVEAPTEVAETSDGATAPTALPEVARALAQSSPPKPDAEEPQAAPSTGVTPDESKILAEMMQEADSLKISWAKGPHAMTVPARPEPAAAPPGPLVMAPEDSAPITTGPAPTAPAPSADSPPRRRPTWRELTLTSPTFPDSDEAPLASNAVAEVPRDQPPRAAPPPPPDDGEAYCRYDSRLRRLQDFRLPDLQGRPVRFQDLDTDLILLDFWGTWCAPCVQSLPHLVDLQKRLGPARLTVVGIACEQGPPKTRTANVAKAVQRYGINYPVLMSGMTGPCPLQQALQIQAFPTMILLDRQGRVVWRDQGATPITLARLDRFLASATRPDDAPRRY